MAQKLSKEALEALAERTGLSRLLCLGLYNAGWTYVEKAGDDYPKWEKR